MVTNNNLDRHKTCIFTEHGNKNMKYVYEKLPRSFASNFPLRVNMRQANLQNTCLVYFTVWKVPNCGVFSGPYLQ